MPAGRGYGTVPRRLIIQFLTIDIQDTPLKTNILNPKVMVFGSDDVPFQLVDFQLPANSCGGSSNHFLTLGPPRWKALLALAAPLLNSSPAEGRQHGTAPGTERKKKHPRKDVQFTWGKNISLGQLSLVGGFNPFEKY